MFDRIGLPYPPDPSLQRDEASVGGYSNVVVQLWDVVQISYSHACGSIHMGTRTSLLFEWLRLPGDLAFIIFGAIPLLIASIKGCLGIRQQAKH